MEDPSLHYKIHVINENIYNYENERERLKERTMHLSKQMAKLYEKGVNIDIMLDVAYLGLKDLGVHEPMRFHRDIYGDCGEPLENSDDELEIPERPQRGTRGAPHARALTALESCLEIYCSIRVTRA